MQIRLNLRPACVLAVLTVVGLIALPASGCSNVGDPTGAAGSVGGQIKVVTTTNFITDTVGQIGGDRVSVKALMGAGVDPHLYKASAGDVSALREADIIFYGGLYLEAKMEEVLAEIAESRPAFAVTESIPREELLEAPANAPVEEEYDPHVWFDPTLWSYAVETVRERLTEVDPDGEAIYRRNAAVLLAGMERMDASAKKRLGSIPATRRVLVTSHDAFRYLGRRYDVDVEAIQGLSTAAGATTDDIERIAQLIADRGVKAVFVETSVPPQTVEAVLASAREKGQPAAIGGELYSDAAGEEGTPEGTYQGMFESNVNLLAEGLR